MRKSKLAKNILRYFVVLIAVVCAVFPIYWIMSTAIKPEGDAVSIKPVFFFKPQFESMIDVLTGTFMKSIVNSIIVALVVLIVSMFFGSLAAYSLARYHVGGKTLVLSILVIQMIPPMIISFQIFLMIQKVHGIDTLWGLIIAELFFSLPFVIWTIRQFVIGMPYEIEEAARIDGASSLQVYFKIVLPMIFPGLISAAIFTFLNSWNEFLFPLILTVSKSQTATIVLSNYVTTAGLLRTEQNAAQTILMLPPILFVLFTRKYIVTGLVGDSIKE